MERYAPGFKNSSKTFQALMNKILWQAGVYTNTHQDDSIITIDSFDEHISHIRDVLESLRLANLTAKVFKTQFTRAKTKCLGSVVGNGKIALTLTRSRSLKMSQFALRRNQFWRSWG